MLASDDELAPRQRDALTGSFVAAVRRREDWEAAVVTARGLRRQELLRIACADLLDLADGRSVGWALSDVSAAVVAAALATASRKVEAERRTPLNVRLAVIAMGRLGGGEQGYSSDADVLFVHDPLPGAAEAEAAAMAQDVAHEVRRLLALPAPDPPLVVDADLRPEGKQGPLSRSLASYRAYYGRWSEVWEAQALLRAAPLTGDPALTEDFLHLVDPVRYPGGGAGRRRRPRGAAHQGAGRERADAQGGRPQARPEAGPGRARRRRVDRAAAAAAARRPAPGPAHDVDPRGAEAARDAGLLDADDAQVLSEAWTLASRARDALVLVRGKAAEALPSSGRELDGTARVLGYPAGAQGQFLDDYRRATRRSRAVVERVFYA
jgi:glutamate-ammonia-ligase adenylyltransferase